MRVFAALVPIVVAGSCFYDFTRLDDLPPGSVAGRTVDAGDSTAISFARIGVEAAPRIVRSRADGSFLIAQLVPGTWLLHLTSDKDGDGAPERSALRAVSIREAGGVLSSVLLGDVPLDGTATLSGRVVDDAGAGVDGARVVVYRNAAELEADQNVEVTSAVDLGVERETGTASGGLFRVAGVTRGNVRVVAIAADGARISAPALVVAPAGADVAVPDLVLEAAGSRAAQVDVVNPPADGNLRVDVVLRGDKDDVLVTHSTPAARIVAGFEVPTGIVDVFVTDVAADGSERRQGVMLGRVVVPGTTPVEWGQVELVGGDPCGGVVDRDGDGLAALPDPATSFDAWVTCASQCAVAFGDDKSTLACDVDGVTFDCDDDGDGQPDVTEPFECVSLCGGTDFDGDAVCSVADPYPDCAENDAASCAPDAGTPGAPASRYGGAILVVSGDGQQGNVGATLQQPLVVSTVDVDGQAVVGVVVEFIVAEGGGVLRDSTVVSDARGIASTTWTLGPNVGLNTVEASSIGRAPVVFTAAGVTSSPFALEIISGDAQQGVAGSTLPAPLVVAVVDKNGGAIAGATVELAVIGGGGTLSAFTATTDAQGLAATTWTLGTLAGSNTVQAASSGLAPVAFNATGVAGPPAVVFALAGDTQSDVAGATLAAPFVVSVQDANGNGVVGIAVDFAVSAGGGVLSSLFEISDAQGRASTTLTLGTSAGLNIVEAAAAGLAPIEFHANGTPGAPAELAAAAGDGQTGVAGSPLAAPLVLLVVDANGNGVAGVGVELAVTEGGGTFSSLLAETDGEGTASIIWTLGAVAGANAAEATAVGLAPITLSATGIAGPAAELRLISGDRQQAPAASTLPEPFVVAVLDVHGNRVSGEIVSFAVTAGGGSLSARAAATDAQGFAATTLTLGPIPGVNTVEALAPQLGPVVFTATGASISCTSGCECPTAQACFNGQCATTCTSDGQCCSPYACEQGTCQLVDPL
jgi:hypothetical protein